jgi:hypothetical protein
VRRGPERRVRKSMHPNGIRMALEVRNMLLKLSNMSSVTLLNSGTDTKVLYEVKSKIYWVVSNNYFLLE